MEIRDHAKERFVQRIMGIENIKAARKYVKENEFEVCFKLLEFINQSKLLYKGYAPARKDTLDYYINGEVMIVMKPDKKEVITLFHVTLDSEDKLNSKKIKEYIKQIKINQDEIIKLNSKKEKQDTISRNLEYLIERTKEQLAQFEMEYEESKSMCIDLAAETKKLRMENREMMSEMFKKLEVESVIN